MSLPCSLELLDSAHPSPAPSHPPGLSAGSLLACAPWPGGPAALPEPLRPVGYMAGGPVQQPQQGPETASPPLPPAEARTPTSPALLQSCHLTAPAPMTAAPMTETPNGHLLP